MRKWLIRRREARETAQRWARAILKGYGSNAYREVDARARLARTAQTDAFLRQKQDWERVRREMILLNAKRWFNIGNVSLP